MTISRNAIGVASELRNYIDTTPFNVGTRLPSINEISQKYKVAPATALKAVKSLESDGLVECVRGKGVFLKERQNSSNIWRVGMLSMDYGGSGLEKEVAFSSYFSVATDFLKEKGRSITRLLKEDMKRSRKEAQAMLYELDALIVSIGCIDPVTIPLLRDWKKPVVVVQHEQVLSLPFHQVIPDLKLGFEKAIKLLYPEAFDVLVVAGTESSTHENRISVFMEALGESLYSDKVLTERINVNKVPADTGRLTGRLLAEKILKTGKLPDVIFCPSDFLSFGILDEFCSRKLKPGVDFKLISYDNLEGNGMLPFEKPMLTSVENPRDLISHQAASLLLNLDKSDSGLTHIIRIPCGIVERETTNGNNP